MIGRKKGIISKFQNGMFYLLICTSKFKLTQSHFFKIIQYTVKIIFLFSFMFYPFSFFSMILQLLDFAKISFLLHFKIFFIQFLKTFSYFSRFFFYHVMYNNSCQRNICWERKNFLTVFRDIWGYGEGEGFLVF